VAGLRRIRVGSLCESYKVSSFSVKVFGFTLSCVTVVFFVRLRSMVSDHEDTHYKHLHQKWSGSEWPRLVETPEAALLGAALVEVQRKPVPQQRTLRMDHNTSGVQITTPVPVLQ
jgi:hypothetical protein